MKKLFLPITALLCIATILTACSGSPAQSAADPASSTPVSSSLAVSSAISEQKPAQKGELYISAAASLTESMTRIAELYKEEAPNVTLKLNFGSSGALQKQIEENAPADIFVSASQKQMDALAEKGLIITDTRKDLLVNKVVLIVPASSTSDITSFEDCLTDKVKMIAIGDPESVPVGQYAKEILIYLNGWDVISAKANLGSDVKQVLSWTATDDVDCGVVYSTDAATSKDVRVIAEAPDGSHRPVIYPAALVKYTASRDAAQAFLDFLSTDQAKQVFIDNGFAVA